MYGIKKGRSNRLISWGVMAILFLGAGCGGNPSPQPTASPIPRPTIIQSPTTSPTALPTPTSTATATFTPLPTSTLIPSQTPTDTPEPAAARIPILEYHYSNFKLSDQVMMTADWYKSQIQWLADNGFHTLSAANLVDFLNGKLFPAKSVVLSFDVGTARRADFDQQIVPALQAHHFTALFFVLVNDTIITDNCGQGDRYCWDELRQWQSDGTVSVESHGLYHPDYTTLTAADIKYDAGQSYKIIQNKVGVAPLGFAYPFDSVSDQAVKVISTLGYQFAVGGFSRSDRSVHPQDADRFNLPRIYPYSNPQIYPVISGANGATFDQLITSSIAGQVPVSGQASATTTTPLPPDNSLVAFCKNNPPVNTTAWTTLLNAKAFTTQISQTVVSQLPMGVVVRPTCNIIAGNIPRAIVLHYTDGSLEGAVATFQLPHNTSAHYIIGRDGSVVQMVPEELGAFHVSCYGYRSYCVPTCPICDMNGKFMEPYLQSIGIELVNAGHVDPTTFHGNIYEDFQNAFGYRFWEDYPPAQIEALKILVQDIRARWHIPWDMVIGHSRVNNKPDPGPALNLFWPRYGNPPRPPIFDITQP